jgi:redox-sensitive bicupin YhaK (pirin superfamily)
MDDADRALPVRVLEPRSVPLGGPRAMTVRRTLPARERSFVGAWCFVDHYGPDDVSVSGGMDVAPHPHCGLATVSWLFSGEVEHRDSLGTHAVVRPGEVNLMTAGRGIAHSEVSTPHTTVLHGAQLWLVLPAEAADVAPRFEHHVPEVVEPVPGVRAQVFVGSLWGSASPVHVESPLLGAEVRLEAGASLEVPVPVGFEVAVLVDTGQVVVAGTAIAARQLAVRDASTETGADPIGGEPGRGPAPLDRALADPALADPVVGAPEAPPGGVPLRLEAVSGPARVLLLGGTPFGEEVVMWWNFIGRSHDEVAVAREAWEAGPDRFGAVDGYAGPVTRLPAPPLPPIRLKARGNRHGTATTRGTDTAPGSETATGLETAPGRETAPGGETATGGETAPGVEIAAEVEVKPGSLSASGPDSAPRATDDSGFAGVEAPACS